ncbi:unnamed protein product [Aureobasidium mustum]|uniref:Uncharacterized protein n=1 Tax=Aureobasidium mustum TaxID=2773714 RepID=A0A9N8KB26_9PEZI|nr:unnamed protein product [Aureobasidium mustum]
MDIQLFENFALPPEVRMDIEVYENFSLAPDDEGKLSTSSAKRDREISSQEERPAKKIRYSDSEIIEGVRATVQHYGLDKTQEENLTTRAKENEVVPTIEEVVWVVKEAQLRDGGQELNWPMFYYMEFYPWYLRSLDDDHRVYVGTFKNWKAECDLWIGFGPESQLHYDGPVPGDNKHVFDLRVEFHRYIRWHTSFEHLFQLSKMRSNSIKDTAGAKKAHQQQSAYIKAAMTVLARFPGLVLERDPQHDELRYQLYGPSWNAFPFWNREARSEETPLDGLFKMLCSKKEGTIKSFEGDQKDGVAAKSVEVAGDDAEEE